jgi:hypothetical protein
MPRRTPRHRRWLATCAVLFAAHWTAGAQAPMPPRPDVPVLADVESAFARISVRASI